MNPLKSKWITKTATTRLYQIPVPIIGLTGGIATGKSTIAKFFLEKNIPVIDADFLVKNIYKKPETLDFLKIQFSEVVSDNNIIDFKKLRISFFKNHTLKTLLENFIYTSLPEAFKEEFSKFSNPLWVVYDAPLLFEKKLNLIVDASICVYSSKEIQLSRLINRDQISTELAENILLNQLPIDEKKNLANLIIENNKSLDDLKKSFESAFKVLIEDRA